VIQACPAVEFGACDGKCKFKHDFSNHTCAVGLEGCYCSGDTVVYTGVIKTYTCQPNGMMTCPCPPAGSPMPDNEEEFPQTLTDCGPADCMCPPE
jgi:hypothetical protein